MPTERRKRRDEQKRQEQSKAGLVRKVIIAVLIVGAFGGAYRLGRRKRTSRLDAFAQCVAEKQAKMYGLYWCTHCAEQKEMFGSSFQYIPYVECGIRGSRGEEASCQQAGVKHFPTWEFGNGERMEGALPLQLLSAKTGCSLP
jgi:hypothetical protein